jgi:putative endonuclease
MFTTYILFSETLQKFYIGFTSTDVNSRIYQRLVSMRGFTAKAKEWEQIYTEQFNSKEEAMAREKQ